MAYCVRIDEGARVKLRDIDPGQDGGLTKEKGEALTEPLGRQMGELHDLLFAAGRHSLLIVLQGLDTSGKDGLIRHLLRYVNAQSARVVPFKVPTSGELAHDFLWRVHAETPARGGIVIFNRSHYEDVLVVRVHGLVPEAVWRKRYDQINDFERNLAGADTVILKFFLHISKKEQEERLLDREKDPVKAWKLSVADWKERELWDKYMDAYEDALSRCSTATAPWHVVPANHKWFRNLAVTDSIVSALAPLKKGWMQYLEKLGTAAKKELDEYRRSKS